MVQKNMLDLSIIVISYNTKDILEGCLASIFAHPPKHFSYEIIVVDNNSTDDSVKAIQDYKSKLQIIQNKENLGFSKANNIGVKKSKGKYILFLNSDTVVHKNTLDVMLSFMEKNKDVGVATCKVIMPNGVVDDASHRGFPTPWNAFCHFSGLAMVFPRSRIFSGYSLGWEDISKIHEIDACAGAFMLVRRDVGDTIGWWDEDYFWYGDDLDFCYRVKEKGWKVYYVPSVYILHYKGVSGGIKDISGHLTSADKETKTRSTLARFEAMKIFYKKHYMSRYPKIVTWFVMQGIGIKLRFASANI